MKKNIFLLLILGLCTALQTLGTEDKNYDTDDETSCWNCCFTRRGKKPAEVAAEVANSMQKSSKVMPIEEKITFEHVIDLKYLSPYCKPAGTMRKGRTTTPYITLKVMEASFSCTLAIYNDKLYFITLDHQSTFSFSKKKLIPRHVKYSSHIDEMYQLTDILLFESVNSLLQKINESNINTFELIHPKTREKKEVTRIKGAWPEDLGILFLTTFAQLDDKSVESLRQWTTIKKAAPSNTSVHTTTKRRSHGAAKVAPDDRSIAGGGFGEAEALETETSIAGAGQSNKRLKGNTDTSIAGGGCGEAEALETEPAKIRRSSLLGKAMTSTAASAACHIILQNSGEYKKAIHRLSRPQQGRKRSSLPAQTKVATETSEGFLCEEGMGTLSPFLRNNLLRAERAEQDKNATHFITLQYNSKTYENGALALYKTESAGNRIFIVFFSKKDGTVSALFELNSDDTVTEIDDKRLFNGTTMTAISLDTLARIDGSFLTTETENIRRALIREWATITKGDPNGVTIETEGTNTYFWHKTNSTYQRTSIGYYILQNRIR